MQKDAKSRFDKASLLYEDGRYAEAFRILDALDREFPDTRHIMFPRARCLAHLGRMDEASAICDLLIVDHAYKPAAQLKKRINAMRHEAVSGDQTRQPPPAQASGAPPQSQDFLAIEIPGTPETGVGNVMDVGVGAGLDLDPNGLANLEIGESFAIPVPSPDEASEEGSHKWGGIAVVAGGVALVLLVLVGLTVLISKLGKGSSDLPPPPPPIAAQDTTTGQEPVAEVAPDKDVPKEDAPAESPSDQVMLTLINSTGSGDLSIRLNGPTRYDGVLAMNEHADVPLKPGYYSTTFSPQGGGGSFWSGDIEGPETWTFALEMGPTGQQCTRTVYGAQLADAGDTAGEEGDEWSEDDESSEGGESWEDEFYEGGSGLFGMAWWLQTLISVALAIPYNAFVLMVTLKLTGKYKHDDFWQNVQETLATSVMCVLLGCVPCIGIFLVIRLLMANYDFGFFDLLVWFGINFVISVLIGALVIGIIFLVIGGAAAVSTSSMLLHVAVSAPVVLT